jgi:ATP-dependent DNA helicase DinG
LDWVAKQKPAARGLATTDNQQSPGFAKPLRVRDPGIVANHLSPELELLAKQIKVAGTKLSEKSEQQDFISAHDRLLVLASELETWRAQSQKGAVYWLESYKTRRGIPRLTLAAAPLDIGPAMREGLFDKVPTVIMTSATLSVGGLVGALFSSVRGRPRPGVGPS